jgi:hypothetical protein
MGRISTYAWIPAAKQGLNTQQLRILAVARHTDPRTSNWF